MVSSNTQEDERDRLADAAMVASRRSFSTPADPEDIAMAYDLHVNAYVTKPTDLDTFFAAVQAIMQFWSATAELPPPL